MRKNLFSPPALDAPTVPGDIAQRAASIICGLAHGSKVWPMLDGNGKGRVRIPATVHNGRVVLVCKGESFGRLALALTLFEAELNEDRDLVQRVGAATIERVGLLASRKNPTWNAYLSFYNAKGVRVC